MSTNWEKCTKYIDGLTTDFRTQIAKYKDYTTTFRSGKYMRIETHLGLTEGFPVHLIVYDGQNPKAWYVAFNNEEKTAYKRDI